MALRMATMNFDTKNDTFRRLLSNGLTYEVPHFQRDYSWTETEWAELWEDISDLFEAGAEPTHYMGYLVLETADNRHFNIIDGQQRITTLSIMILAVINCLRELKDEGLDVDNNTQRIEQFQNSYIGYLDPVSLVSQSKLKLNSNNDRFYQSYLVRGDSSSDHGLNASEKEMQKAFDWFRRHIKERFGMTDASGKKLAEFLDALVDKLFFTVITVNDQLNAYKVFETLNARGVHLSATDLLKNHLFSIIDSAGGHKTEMDSMESMWKNIVGILENENFTDFLYVFWNSRNLKVRKAKLFKTIREDIKNKGAAFDLLRDLDKFAPIYVALKDPQDGLWNDKEKSSLRALKIFGVLQPLPMLMACYDKFHAEGKSDFAGILRNIVVLSMRYNIICNLQANRQEIVYNNIAYAVSNGTYSTPQDVTNALRELYPDDSTFRSAFADKQATGSTRNNKRMRYLLFEIERKHSGKALDINDAIYSVEHILPKQPCEAWPKIDASKRERMTNRIGNLTLLETKKNRNLSNAAYSKKRKIYKDSEFKMTQKVAERYDVWDEESIESRQKQMAKTATSVWKISFPKDA